jgi:hypothetical protein
MASLDGWRDPAPPAGDGRELFYLAADGRMMAVSVGGGTNCDAGAPVALFEANSREPVATSEQVTYGVLKDGQRFLINTRAKNFEKQALDVVLNWTQSLSNEQPASHAGDYEHDGIAEALSDPLPLAGWVDPAECRQVCPSNLRPAVNLKFFQNRADVDNGALKLPLVSTAALTFLRTIQLPVTFCSHVTLYDPPIVTRGHYEK